MFFLRTFVCVCYFALCFLFRLRIQWTFPLEAKTRNQPRRLNTKLKSVFSQNISIFLLGLVH